MGKSCEEFQQKYLQTLRVFFTHLIFVMDTLDHPCAHRGANSCMTITLQQLYKPAIDLPWRRRSAKDETSHHLHECRSALNFFVGILCAKDATQTDQSKAMTCRSIDGAQQIVRSFLGG